MSDNNDSSRSDRKRDANNARSFTPAPPAEPRTEGPDVGASDGSNETFTRHQWEDLHSDPDLRGDLGYEIASWETIDTATDASQVIYMPQNEELLKDDAFIVADEGVLRDLGKHY